MTATNASHREITGRSPGHGNRQTTDHWQAAAKQPFAGQGPPQFSQQQGVCLDFNIVCDETGPPIMGDITGNLRRQGVIRVIRVQQGKNGARVPQDSAPH
jgi:hypothetical protein